MHDSLDPEKSERYRIAFVETGSGKGGSAQSLGRIAKVLAEAYESEIEPCYFAFGEEGVSMFRVDADKKVSLIRGSFLQHFWCMRKHLKQKRIQLLHCNNLLSGNIAFAFAAASLGIPVTIHSRGSRPLLLREEFALQWVQHCFAVSQSADDILNVQSILGPLHRTLLGDGTDLQAIQDAQGFREAKRNELGIGRDEFVVTVPATLQPGKGQESAIEASDILEARAVPVVFLLAGGEHYQFLGYRKKLEGLCAQDERVKRIRILGHCADFGVVLAASDIVALPSTLREGMPCVIMEAMAARLPVVASDVGGIPEAVAETVGRLIPAGDSQQLAAAIEFYVQDRDALKRAGLAAFEQAKRCYDIRVITEQMVEVLKRLIEENS